MNEVGRRFCDPDFGFPRNLGEIPRPNRPRRERGDVDKPSLRAPEKVFQFVSPLSIDRAVTGHRLRKDKPASLGVVDNDIGHTPMPIRLRLASTYAECGASSRLVTCGWLMGPIWRRTRHLHSSVARVLLWRAKNPRASDGRD
jgi:hypothetical protein